MLILKKFVFNLLFHKEKCYSSVKKIVYTSRASKKYIYLSLFRGRGKKILQPERRKRRIRFVRLINFQEGKWRRPFISLARISKACEDKKSSLPYLSPRLHIGTLTDFPTRENFPLPKKQCCEIKELLDFRRRNA